MGTRFQRNSIPFRLDSLSLGRAVLPNDNSSDTCMLFGDNFIFDQAVFACCETLASTCLNRGASLYRHAISSAFCA